MVDVAKLNECAYFPDIKGKSNDLDERARIVARPHLGLLDLMCSIPSQKEIRVRSLRILPIIGTAALALAACAGGSTPTESTASAEATQPAETTVLNVYAAASLTETFGELEEIFEEANPGVDVRFNFAGSQDLVTQLGEGADVDVLATANESTMKKAADASQVDAQTIFVTNTLTLITTPGNPAGVTGLDSSLDGVKLVICAPEVPCGKLTKTLTEKLGVTLNPVSEEQAVTDVRGKVSSGQADAGIVYKTDALAEGDAVETVAIQGADEAVNKYPIALVTASTKKDLGQKWIDLVLSADGQKILEGAGFTPAAK